MITTHRPVFIIAPERSGSTLLRLVLSAHPQVCFPPEGCVALALRKVVDCRTLDGRERELADVLFAREPKLAHLWGLVPEVVVERWRRRRPLTPQTLVEEVYLTYRDRCAPEATVYGDKNSIHAFHMPLLQRFHPSARFVYLLRDPRATYASAKRLRAGSPWEGFSQSVTASAIMWRQAALLAAAAREGPDAFTLRYEELVSNPEEQLRQLCAWIGVAYCPELLDTARRKPGPGVEARGGYPHTPLNLQEVSGERQDLWREELDPAEIAAIEFLLGTMMRRVKYCPEARRVWRGLALLAREATVQPFKLQLRYASPIRRLMGR